MGAEDAGTVFGFVLSFGVIIAVVGGLIAVLLFVVAFVYFALWIPMMAAKAERVARDFAYNQREERKLWNDVDTLRTAHSLSDPSPARPIRNVTPENAKSPARLDSQYGDAGQP